MYRLTGLKIKAVRGQRGRDHGGRLTTRKKRFAPELILFDDKKTFIILGKQDGHDYHDCDWSARTVTVVRDKKLWKLIIDDKYMHPKADMELCGY